MTCRDFADFILDYLSGGMVADVIVADGFAGNIFLKGAEGVVATDERREQGLDFEDLPSIVAKGWSAEVRRRLGRSRDGARTRAREIDLGVRFDWLSFDDSGSATGRDSVRLRATDVRARDAGTVTAGVSWRPTRWGRILGNASLERYGDARSAPEAGRTGSYVVLSTRFQIELP